MTNAKKTGGLLLLAAFLGCVAWSSGFAWPDCCAPACDSCPIVYCKVTPATAAHKVDASAAVMPATFALDVAPTRVMFARLASQIPSFLPHEFRRPMRN